MLVRAHTSALLLVCVCLAVDFDYDLSYRVVDFARMSYCEKADIESFQCEICAEMAQPLSDIWVSDDNKEHTQVLVGYQQDMNAVVVAFRGSQDFTNWLYNLHFSKVDQNFDECLHCKVHKGFSKAYGVVADAIHEQVQKRLTSHPDAVVYVTGHSLGGALATFAALDLRHGHNISNLFMFTYGAPRVGNKYFADFFDGLLGNSSFRLTHEFDLVPHVPPLGETPFVSFNFFHVAREIWQHTPHDDYGEEKDVYQVCDDSGEDPECSNSVSVWKRSSQYHTHYMGKRMSHCLGTTPSPFA